MIQITITTPDEFSSLTSSAFVESPLFEFLIGIGIVIALFLAALFIVRNILRRRHHGRHGAFEMVVLLIMLPKEAAEADQKSGNEDRLDQIREGIGVAESFLAAIGGLKAERGLKAWLLGREDHFSFEIVAQHGLISFYVATPRNYQQFIEQQLHAQYPDAAIEEVTDYNMFVPRGAIAGSMLVAKKHHALPLKTYRAQESDPLNAITNALSKVPKDEGAVIQYVVRSARGEWRKAGVKIASTMQQGKSYEDAKKSLSVIGNLLGSFGGKKKKKEDGTIKEPELYKLSPLEEEMIKAIEQKSGKLGLDVNIRLMVSAKTKDLAEHTLRGIVGAYAQYNLPQYGNVLGKKAPGNKALAHDFIFRNFDEKRGWPVSTEEFVSLFHFPLPTTETPNIRWLMSRKAAPPSNLPQEGILLGHVKYRGADVQVRMKQKDRQRHFYIIGRSGVGKTVLMKNMAIQDIRDGKGVCVIDPHGDFIEDMLKLFPKERADDLIVFSPYDVERPIGLNMLEARTEEERDFATQEMIAIFYKLVSDPQMIGPMFEHYMRNAMLTLMSDPEHQGTIVEIPRILTDPGFQKLKLQKVTDPILRAFWEKELPQTSGQTKGEMLPYLVSKIGRFIENSMVRNIIGQEVSGFNLRDVMDKQKVLLVDLSKGKTGEMNAKLLGLILVTKLQMAALGRANMPEEERKDFYLYIDEFQNFVTDSIATILSEARKYRLDLIVAHQYLSQLEENNNSAVRDAVLGNAGTIVANRIGVEDAEVFEKEFKPTFNAYDLINVEQYTTNIKLLIDNTASRPFNMHVYPPEEGDPKLSAALRQLSRLKYGRPKEIVEAEIFERTQLG